MLRCSRSALFTEQVKLQSCIVVGAEGAVTPPDSPLFLDVFPKLEKAENEAGDSRRMRHSNLTYRRTFRFKCIIFSSGATCDRGTPHPAIAEAPNLVCCTPSSLPRTEQNEHVSSSGAAVVAPRAAEPWWVLSVVIAAFVTTAAPCRPLPAAGTDRPSGVHAVGGLVHISPLGSASRGRERAQGWPHDSGLLLVRRRTPIRIIEPQLLSAAQFSVRGLSPGSLFTLQGGQFPAGNREARHCDVSAAGMHLATTLVRS
ncbi:hypothetical protein MTO96_024814 [Rhipicephalus appendiculatus]